MADEITCLDVASAIAEAALSAMEGALAPGITERDLLGVYDERLAGLGYKNIRVHHADGSHGLPTEAPFDAILSF